MAARGSRSDTMDAKEAGIRSGHVRVSRDAVATGRQAVKGHLVKQEAGIWSGGVRAPKDAGATGKKERKFRPVKKLKAAAAAAASSEAKKPAAASSAASSEAKKPAAASAAGGVTKMEDHAGDVTMAVAGEAGTAGKEEGGVRLSQKYIDFVLSWEPEVLEDPDEMYARMIKNPLYSREDVERRTEIQRSLVRQLDECAASVESFHAWVRAEYKEKGYVEVDDDYIAQSILLRQAMEEDPEYARAFGPMEGLVFEGEEDDEFVQAGPVVAALSEI